MKKQTIYVVNVDTNEWFFHNEHSGSEFGENCVPCSRSIPFKITPRKYFEDGVIDTIEKFRKFLNGDSFSKGKEIINPMFKQFCENILKNNGVCKQAFCDNCPIIIIKDIWMEDCRTFCDSDTAILVAEKYLNYFMENENEK